MRFGEWSIVQEWSIAHKMGKIFYIMGKSASGKDTIYRELQKIYTNLRTVVPYTTRPVRSGETEGVEYHFITEEALQDLEESGKLIEKRTYKTVFGPWSYGTVDDGQIDLEKSDYLMIGTLESYRSTSDYFGREQMIPLYIEVEDGVRLSRAVERERRQEHPKYDELCRRFLADCVDFSEEKLREAGIGKRYENTDLDACIMELKETIEKYGRMSALPRQRDNIYKTL